MTTIKKSRYTLSKSIAGAWLVAVTAHGDFSIYDKIHYAMYTRDERGRPDI